MKVRELINKRLDYHKKFTDDFYKSEFEIPFKIVLYIGTNPINKKPMSYSINLYVDRSGKIYINNAAIDDMYANAKDFNLDTILDLDVARWTRTIFVKSDPASYFVDKDRKCFASPSRGFSANMIINVHEMNGRNPVPVNGYRVCCKIKEGEEVKPFTNNTGRIQF